MLSRYSHSALDAWRSCPRKFKFAYIDKVSIPDRVTPDAYLGSAVHRVLNKLYSLGADGVIMPKDDALKMYQDEWNKIDRNAIVLVKDYYTVDDMIRLGREMLDKHYDKYQPFKYGTLLGTELNLYFDLKETPFKVRAIIDKIVKLDDGTVQIVDYKTGKQIPKVTDNSFRYQMGLYQLAVQKNYPQYENVELVMHNLRVDEIISYKMNDDELDEIAFELKNQIVETIQAEKFDDFPVKESVLCDYCDYFNLCPAKRHQLKLEQQPKSEQEEKSVERQGLELANKYIEIYTEYKRQSNELEALKEEIKSFARENDFAKLTGEKGDVSIKIATGEKFVTKTDDAKAFGDLSMLAKQMQLDDFFKLDGQALMKEIYKKQMLPEEQLEKLKQFVISREECTVRVKLKKDNDDVI